MAQTLIVWIAPRAARHQQHRSKSCKDHGTGVSNVLCSKCCKVLWFPRGVTVTLQVLQKCVMAQCVSVARSAPRAANSSGLPDASMALLKVLQNVMVKTSTAQIGP
ncbi:hypothetical protein DUNSADRAFT_7832 [Dunaliella salina]|uniref:Encoded protein n=1 Tax=Dunaliella salina TaxID=3046 RepID=A0ABQ7GKL4_DUNSA|nr:hypothetical protein DUNSADRAFT_7832 [Dunaliella salina]|eukprot:KAF5835157.1 hypothetical protein DUNSADRAFT_7832 [Dunaliella salina]